MADILVFAETRAGALRGVAREATSTGSRIAAESGAGVHALVIGGPGVAQAAASLAEHGAERIFVAEGAELAQYSPDAAVRTVAKLHGQHDYAAILFPASAQGKDLAPRVAARLGRALATEVTAISTENGELVVERPMYAGKAYGRFRFKGSPALVSLRPNVFPVEQRPAAGALEPVSVPAGEERICVTEIEASERAALDVREADVVVAGGRGLQSAENWSVLEDLVESLGDEATLGASRAVVDAGWRPHGEQVGQTGKVVSPSLYFAVGISGAIQHLAGMRTAKVIVAINRDREAPIFNVADYGIVGDALEIVPRLAEEVRAARAARG
ncbi:MAG: electron transfer flavoprotein subunit alpha/FixB family protein [Gemmatimonadota bacterium]